MPPRMMYDSSRVVDFTTGVELWRRNISITQAVTSTPSEAKTNANMEEAVVTGWYSCVSSRQA